jgi:hypothetical protein
MDQILPPDWIQWLTIFNTTMSVTALMFAVISGIHRFFIKPSLDIQLHTHDLQAIGGSVKFRIVNATIFNRRTWKFGKTATHCEGRLILDQGREHPLCWTDYDNKQVIDITPNNSATLELIRIVIGVNRASICLPNKSETVVERGIYRPVLRVTCKERSVEKTLGDLRIPEDVLEKGLFGSMPD